jgi:hypothetical protein
MYAMTRSEQIGNKPKRESQMFSKARYQANREAEIARHTKYREDHREYLCEKISSPVCKKLVTRRDIAQHKRGRTCMKAEQEQQAQQSEELGNGTAVFRIHQCADS